MHGSSEEGWGSVRCAMTDLVGKGTHAIVTPCIPLPPVCPSGQVLEVELGVGMEAAQASLHAAMMPVIRKLVDIKVRHQGGSGARGVGPPSSPSPHSASPLPPLKNIHLPVGLNLPATSVCYSRDASRPTPVVMWRTSTGSASSRLRRPSSPGGAAGGRAARQAVVVERQRGSRGGKSRSRPSRCSSR